MWHLCCGFRDLIFSLHIASVIKWFLAVCMVWGCLGRNLRFGLNNWFNWSSAYANSIALYNLRFEIVPLNMLHWKNRTRRKNATYYFYCTLIDVLTQLEMQWHHIQYVVTARKEGSGRRHTGDCVDLLRTYKSFLIIKDKQIICNIVPAQKLNIII